MNVFDCIFSRRSVRAFKPDDVDDKLIGVMLYAAIHAPSAGNIQEWHFVVIKDETKRKRLADAAFDQKFIAEAPVCIVVAADLEKASLRYGKRGENLYALQDTANAITIIMLAANELGLGTCWIGSFDEDRVSHVAELPEGLRPVAILPLGYPAKKPEMPERVPFENIVSFNGYGKKFDIAYAIQPEPGKELRFKPLGNFIEDLMKETKKKVRKLEKKSK
jgi:nitroreductase